MKKKFDGIFMKASLLHIPKSDAQDVIKKIINKLKKGGYIYVAVKGKWESGVDEEIKKENLYGDDFERFFSYYTVDEIKNYFINLGLEIVYEESAISGKTNWIQVVGKK